MEPASFLSAAEDLFLPSELKELAVAPAFLYLKVIEMPLALPKFGIVGREKCNSPMEGNITLQLARPTIGRLSWHLCGPAVVPLAIEPAGTSRRFAG